MHGLQEIKKMNKSLDERIKDVLEANFVQMSVWDWQKYLDEVVKQIVKELHRMPQQEHGERVEYRKRMNARSG